MGILSKDKVSDADLDRIIQTEGIDELVYNKITKSLLIRFNKSVLTTRRLFSRIRKVFPGSEFACKEIPTAEMRKDGMINSRVFKFLKKISPELGERLEKCLDVALVIPLGATIHSVEGLKGYQKNVFSRSWINFIWALIAL